MSQRIFPMVSREGIDNPAIKLFGNRFISEQTAVEFLSEFLAVLFSHKWLGDSGPIESMFPSIEVLRRWRSMPEKLEYKLSIRLTLKLFAFMTCSRVDSRHAVHVEQYRKIRNRLEQSVYSHQADPREVVDCLEDLLRGLQGAGLNRTWCAQTFWPSAPSLVTQETIWNESVSRREKVESWEDSIYNFHKYYSVSKHRFMARGGEVLYLQLCNLFAADHEGMSDFLERLRPHEEEVVMSDLYSGLTDGFGRVFSREDRAFDRLVEFIERCDTDTWTEVQRQTRRLECGWCPSESWQEAYLWAVETNRLLRATIDPAELLELLMTGCVLQVLRSISAQSVRYVSEGRRRVPKTALDYAWVFSPARSPDRRLVVPSQRSLQTVLRTIQQAIRHPHLIPHNDREKRYREADTRYGHKLFLALGKKMGMIVPQRGPGARFVMSERILRYLVLTLIEPGEQCTYDEFILRLFCHFGIAVEGQCLSAACAWSGLPSMGGHQHTVDSWFKDMLRSGGFLHEMSDAFAMVRNEFHRFNQDEVVS